LKKQGTFVEYSITTYPKDKSLVPLKVNEYVGLYTPTLIQTW